CLLMLVPCQQLEIGVQVEHLRSPSATSLPAAPRPQAWLALEIRHIRHIPLPIHAQPHIDSLVGWLFSLGIRAPKRENGHLRVLLHGNTLPMLIDHSDEHEEAARRTGDCATPALASSRLLSTSGQCALTSGTHPISPGAGRQWPAR